MTSAQSLQEDEVRPGELNEIVERVARLLPAQGPIDVFVHHNPLHAFEHLPFEQAILQASKIFGCEPYLTEQRYREEIGRGRIQKRDLIAIVDQELGGRAQEEILPHLSRRRFQRSLLIQGLREETGPELDWILSETTALHRLREDLSAAQRERLLGPARQVGKGRRGARREDLTCTRLWEACLALAPRGGAEIPLRVAPLRPRDQILSRWGFDLDTQIHPLLIRASAAYVDQGISYWPAPEVRQGFHGWFCELYGGRRTTPPAAWMKALPALLREDLTPSRTALESLSHSLRELDVPEDKIESLLGAEALALSGWAGMMRQLEIRPDRAPGRAPFTTLRGFLAVRFLLLRSALTAWCLQHPDRKVEVDHWYTEAAGREPRRSTDNERAWIWYQLAQILGWTAQDLESMDEVAIQNLWGELAEFDGLARRRLLHLAYERRHRIQILDALSLPRHAGDRPRARYQAVFCLDEREESLRRHLEEADAAIRTYGTAGHFGVAMYYRGLGEAHARPLCPVSIVPVHEVEEVSLASSDRRSQLQGKARRSLGQVHHGTALGSRTLVRGTMFSLLIGSLSVIPLVLRVLFPRWTARVRRRSALVVQPVEKTRLRLLHEGHRGSQEGRAKGFTEEEMAAILLSELENIGLTRDFTDLVFFVGHGSSSLNNPHESAHDCGACGGGRGGPNARALADMANRPGVRDRLRAQGVDIPESTWFVGAYHNTCDDHVTWFDTDLIPEVLRGECEAFVEIMDLARQRDARERCRRFDNFCADGSEEVALRHVEGRSQDLAQPRPEFGHAGNSSCIIGRRALTERLFMDRRAFLTSYDPDQDDPDGRVLARVLRSAIPVVAGINLEYYFGYVDPVGYGCSTKLPHNISGLLGVMEGHASDLRTGLPWQMVEIHEPVRLVVCVEAEPSTLLAILDREEQVRRLVRNRWIDFSCLDPRSRKIHRWTPDGFVEYEAESLGLTIAETSRDYYQGKEGPLRPAEIQPVLTTLSHTEDC